MPPARTAVPPAPPISLPRPPRKPELPRTPAPTRALRLPPRPTDAAPRETERTEPGSWREIIARFEHELGDVVEAEDQADVGGADRTESVEPPAVEDQTAELTPPTPEEPSLPWEFEAMTTRDYVPHRPIEDPGHEDWPIEAEDGAVVEPWSPETEESIEQDDEAVDEILLDDVAPVDPWDVEAEPDDEPAPVFPLDAFIVPPGTRRVPSGYDEESVARRVATRLDELAEELRAGGLTALGAADSADALSRVLAAIVTGYVARDG